MRSTQLKGLVVAAALVLLLTPALYAQTTRGSIEGTVVSGEGAPLPGVTVTVSSDDLIGGARVVVTDADGQFRVTNLPPADYSVDFALEGFATLHRDNVHVSINQSTTIRVSMTGAFGEEVVVTGESALVNTTSAETGVSIDSSMFGSLATGRDYTAIARVAPGAQTDASGTTFYGSTGAENAYYIDGVNTTGVELGQQGKALNFEFIEEVQVKTGGYNAEYGRNTGGIINVITKSGGNEFHGDVFGYYDSDSLQAEPGGRGERARSPARSAHRLHPPGLRRRPRRLLRQGQAVVLRRLRPGGQRAHPRVDRELRRPSSPARRPGQEFKDKTDRDLYAGQADLAVSPTAHAVSFSRLRRPDRPSEGALGSLAGPADATTRQTSTPAATDYVVNYDGVLSDQLRGQRPGRRSTTRRPRPAAPARTWSASSTTPTRWATAPSPAAGPGAPSSVRHRFLPGPGVRPRPVPRRRLLLRRQLRRRPRVQGRRRVRGRLGEERQLQLRRSADLPLQLHRLAVPERQRLLLPPPLLHRPPKIDADNATAADINNPLTVDTKAEDVAYFAPGHLAGRCRT